jgi:hypothetical protein
MFDNTFRKPMTLTAAPRGASRTLFLLVVATAALLALGAQAQSAAPASPVTPPAASAPVVVAAAPKYAAKDIERAFAFIDSNKDGKLSREEASGFRGVAKYFDEADANKDSTLSREEFHSALNGERSR